MVTRFSDTSFYVDDVFIDLLVIRARLLSSQNIEIMRKGSIWLWALEDAYMQANEQRILRAIYHLEKLGIVL